MERETQAAQDHEFYPGFYWKFLLVAIAGNIINHLDAHWLHHPLAVGVLAVAGLYAGICAAVGIIRGGDLSVLPNLLFAVSMGCLAACYFRPSGGFWLGACGYALLLVVFLVQYIRWKRGGGQMPSAA